MITIFTPTYNREKLLGVVKYEKNIYVYNIYLDEDSTSGMKNQL